MKKSVSPGWLRILAVLCVGYTPAENTATPSPVVKDADTQPVTFEGIDDVGSIEFSTDSMTLASGNRGKTISLWDVSTRQESARLTGHRFPAVSLTFSPYGNLQASACDDYHTKKGEILIWDVQTNNMSIALDTQNICFSFVCCSPDGKTLASAGPRHSITSWDVGVHLWDASTGQKLRILKDLTRNENDHPWRSASHWVVS